MTLPYLLHSLAQQLDMTRQQVTILSLQQIEGKEIGTARMPATTIIRHDNSSRKFPYGAIFLYGAMRCAYWRPTRHERMSLHHARGDQP
jgi:hypothetical protein